MATIKTHTKCRVCGNELLPIINLGEHYLHGSFQYPDFQPPTRKSPVELVRCNTQTGGCGLVQLRHSIDPDILYARYGYRSSTNATMRDHLTKIAHKAINKFLPKNVMPTCLDIGCNDGFLLSQYPIDTTKYGIDPCDIGNTITGLKHFHFINDMFPTKACTQSFDIITMIACFYDVNDPIEVARALAKQLNSGGMLIVEVSYWPVKMKQTAIDEVCQEHVAFYNYQNLEYIFEQAGLKVFDVECNNINGGSIQLWLCHKDKTKYDSTEGRKNILAIKFDEFNQCLDTDIPYKKFHQNCIKLKTNIRNLFYRIDQKGKVVHLYGASTKGNVLLQFLGLDNKQIPFAAERSCEKWGGSTVGTNIKMISEEESRSMKPDYYFVPIWSFRDEIIEREKEFIINGGQLIFPLPILDIINTARIRK